MVTPCIIHHQTEISPRLSSECSPSLTSLLFQLPLNLSFKFLTHSTRTLKYVTSASLQSFEALAKNAQHTLVSSWRKPGWPFLLYTTMISFKWCNSVSFRATENLFTWKLVRISPEFDWSYQKSASCIQKCLSPPGPWEHGFWMTDISSFSRQGPKNPLIFIKIANIFLKAQAWIDSALIVFHPKS